MNYGQVKAAFQTRLVRRDATAALVDGWLQETILRTQRLLRTPAQEIVAEYHITDAFTGLELPGDLLELRGLVADGIELTRADRQTVLTYGKVQGQPQYYFRDGGALLVGPKPKEGAVIRITYLANFAALIADADTNFLTEGAYDALINGAMKLACVHYNDPRAQLFEQEFVTALQDLNNMAARDETSNAAISPGFDLDY